MTSGAKLTQRFRLATMANLAVALVLAVFAGAMAYQAAHSAAETERNAIARETLAVQSETLNGMLEKYRLLPALMTKRLDVQAIFLENDARAAQNGHIIAREVAGLSGALDVVLLRTNGEVLASGIGLIEGKLSPATDPMAAALQGRLGRSVKQLEGGNRAYIFASGVYFENQIIGVVAVYVGLEALEYTWSLTTNPILAIDETGTIIMSNQLRWRTESIETVRTGGGDVATYALSNKQAASSVDETGFYELYQRLPLLNWRLGVLTDPAPLREAGLSWAVIAVLVVALLAGANQFFLNERFQARRRERLNRAIALRLERLVRDRTHELLTANTALEHEIAERRLTEEKLRTMQDELVQTGKLAALGQMSTALSHEYNQPLAAIKSYAGNALTFLSRGRIDETQENIGRISELTDRMADISRHLRNFARRPETEIGVVALRPVVDDALKVLHARLREQQAEIKVDIPDHLTVRAGHVRLQQVLVNLIVNALDATEDKTPALITITGNETPEAVTLTVADNGPGISADIASSIFDPFVSTKGVGKGLGLGLSISFNIVKDFGGRLSVHNRDSGGAAFVIELQAGSSEQEAAE